MDQRPYPDPPARRPWPSLVLVAFLLLASAGAWVWEENGGHGWILPFLDQHLAATRDAQAWWRYLSLLGNGWILAMFLFAWLLMARQPERVLWCLLALLAAGLVVGLLKGLVDRPRPTGDQGTAWPSGHSAAVFAVATLFPSERTRLLAAYPFAFLVGCSRVVLQRHYPADVLAGAAFGILSGAILQRWNPGQLAWPRAPLVAMTAGALLFLICLFRGSVDLPVVPMVGMFGAPLFLGALLIRLLRAAPEGRP